VRRITRRFSTQLVLLGTIAFCSLFAEACSNTWGAIYAHDSLHGSKAAGAFVVSAYAVMQLAGRLIGDRVVVWIGRRRFLVISGLIASLGLAVGLASGSVVGAILGFAALGLGLAATVPTAFGAAGNLPEHSSGVSVLGVSFFSLPAGLVGPVIVGLLAASTSVRVGLFIPVLAALILSLLGIRVRDHGIRSLGVPLLPE
jgi:MFS family permease